MMTNEANISPLLRGDLGVCIIPRSMFNTPQLSFDGHFSLKGFCIQEGRTLIPTETVGITPLKRDTPLHSVKPLSRGDFRENA